MKFKNLPLTEWEKLIKNDFSTLYNKIEDSINIPPYSTTNNNANQPLFKSNIKLVAPANYNNKWADILYRNIDNYKTENLKNGWLFCTSFQEILEIESLQSNNNYTYCINLFNLFETSQSTSNYLFNEYDIYNTFSEQIKEKITFIIDVSLHQNAGANFTQQLSIVLAKLSELVARFSSEILPKTFIKVALSEKFIIEISKLKSLKILLSNFCNHIHLNNLEIPIIAESTQINKTKIDQENNLIRSTLETSAAFIGGANYFLTQSFSFNNTNKQWAIDVSIKQFLLLSKESLLEFYNDALTGSYSIEEITKSLTEAAWEKFKLIEKNNGYIAYFEVLLASINQEKINTINKINNLEHNIIGFNTFNNQPFKPINIPEKLNYLTPFKLFKNDI